MFTVSITVNGKPVYARSVRNTSPRGKKGKNEYITDAGDKIKFDPDKGTIALAHKVLDTIKEV